MINFPKAGIVGTEQEMFDKVANHLFNQGCKSADACRCLYRGPNGTKCAIGCLIPDELYKLAFESETLSYILVDYLINFDSVGYRFLADLQLLHDTFDRKGSESWEGYLNRRLKGFAIDHNLIFSVPTLQKT
jgi:hypothetical protein